ncbi:GNAT family N-acetyltransferase [Acinetobacter sp. ANC 4654]|uniref:GNAT family N-acetyltransferase n=1 Tax=Acinetobacter sp. ANC 4654 TaxID=1977872 RepID=UPI003A4C74D3
MRHIAISPVSISSAVEGWFGLGPIAVSPKWQHHGVGSALMQAALKQLKTTGAAGCVVLGDPHFYAQFGFQPSHTLILEGVPAEYFQYIAFQWKIFTRHCDLSCCFFCNMSKNKAMLYF